MWRAVRSSYIEAVLEEFEAVAEERPSHIEC